MDPMGLAMILVLICIHFGYVDSRPDRDWHRLRSHQSSNLQHLKFQDAFNDVRREMSFLTCGLFGVHLIAFCVFSFGYLAYTQPDNSRWLFLLAVTVVDYPSMVYINKCFEHMSTSHVCFGVLYQQALLLAMAFVLYGEKGQLADFSIDSFLTTCRFTIAIMAVNTRLTAPMQVLASAIAISQRSSICFLVSELFVLASVISVSIFLESSISSQIEAKFETTHAESMLAGFRRLLRGVCDGEFLLDNHLNIHGDAQSLKQLLMMSTSLNGKSFEKLLQPEAKQRLAELIATTGDLKASIPPCLRASLRGANDICVPVDLFHVPVQLRFGVHHLIAFREDAESRIPEATAELPQFARNTGAPSCRSQRSMRSSSVASSRGTLEELDPAAQEASLLIDASTKVLDICQAHWRYEKTEESAMPNLQSIIPRSDWRMVRGTVQAYARSQHGPKEFKDWPLKYSGKQLVARKVILSRASGSLNSPPKFWVQLREVRKDAAREADDVIEASG
ncbi:unnamed protein product [Effrenium voratum]|uniref:Uncharacterized protein n=1 Tax=Effrenium voratum TaxID=2562239 RepID=A0AA36IYB5_9DINO|nr:unnamed protein product [Effrenium voratum]CAJ1446697.1 unnamed protein product [Effrenium voratum]